RDWSVTGVQTCALPIYHFLGRLEMVRKPASDCLRKKPGLPRLCPLNCQTRRYRRIGLGGIEFPNEHVRELNYPIAALAELLDERSEERRVGEEGRRRGE